MQIKVNYNRKEIEKILLDAHKKIFGNPPDGDEWRVYINYSDGYSIENEACKIKAEDLAAEDMANDKN